MSPLSGGGPTSSLSFPRVSGDEPRVQAVFDRYNAFSPRERG